MGGLCGTPPLSIIDIDSAHFRLLEHFIVLMYDKTSELQYVNKARKDLFCNKGRVMEMLPQHRKHCCSIPNEWHIKLQYGAPVSKMSNRTHLQKAGGRHLMCSVSVEHNSYSC